MALFRCCVIFAFDVVAAVAVQVEIALVIEHDALLFLCTFSSSCLSARSCFAFSRRNSVVSLPYTSLTFWVWLQQLLPFFSSRFLPVFLTPFFLLLPFLLCPYSPTCFVLLSHVPSCDSASCHFSTSIETSSSES